MAKFLRPAYGRINLNGFGLNQSRRLLSNGDHKYETIRRVVIAAQAGITITR